MSDITYHSYEHYRHLFDYCKTLDALRNAFASLMQNLTKESALVNYDDTYVAESLKNAVLAFTDVEKALLTAAEAESKPATANTKRLKVISGGIR